MRKTDFLPNANVSAAAFLVHVDNVCKEHGAKFELRRGKRVDSGDGIFCHGYFEDHGTPTLCCAAGNGVEALLPILVHEFAHCTQWIDDTSVWRDAKAEKIFPWVSHRTELTSRQADKYFKAARMLEYDAEKRAVKLIKRWGLPIQLPRYIRTANAYLAFYRLMRDYRTWYTTAPYDVPEIVALMPTKFLSLRQLDNPSDEYRRLVLKYCIAKRVATAHR